MTMTLRIQTGIYTYTQYCDNRLVVFRPLMLSNFAPVSLYLILMKF